MTSSYDKIGIAGNIIPAIATTNAIIASIQVQQAINVIISINKNTSSSNTTTTTASTEEDLTNAAVTPSSSSPSSSSSSSSSIAAANQIKCSHVYCLRLPTRKGIYKLSPVHIHLSLYPSIYLSSIYLTSIYVSIYNL